MSSETSAVNVHGAWSAKRLTLLAMMLALISVYCDSASVFGCKDHSADDDCQPDRSADCTTGYHFSYGELAAVRLMRRAGIQRRKRRTGKTAWTERRLLYRISGCCVPDFPVLPEMEKCCIPDSVPDCSWYSGDLRIRCRLDETRDRTAVGCSYRAVDNSVYSAGHR